MFRPPQKTWPAAYPISRSGVRRDFLTSGSSPGLAYFVTLNLLHTTYILLVQGKYVRRLHVILDLFFDMALPELN